MRETVLKMKRHTPVLMKALAVPTIIATGAMIVPAHVHAQEVVDKIATQVSQIAQPQDAGQAPNRTEHPVLTGLPDGVSIDRVEWLSDRRIAIFIRSAVMPEQPIQVQMLLARDWFAAPDRSFPAVWALDGLRASDTENGWTAHTNIAQYFADKNVNVILPVGGESSFYADWQTPNNGKNYKWESFLINELIPVLREGFRTNDDRAITGISMGATAAVNIAEHHPELFKFVGSFSGYLDVTSKGMPEAIRGAQAEVGGYDSTAMWGEPGSQGWKDHDPKLGVEKLRGITTYVSAGTGRDDFGQPGSVATDRANYAGRGLEVVSRMTTQTFVDTAKRQGVEVVQKFRPAGVHSWPYWQFEIAQAWPYIADSLGLGDADRGSSCAAVGIIAEAVKDGRLGACTNNEYPLGAGKAEDFVGGRVYWSENTGAKALTGKINAYYSKIGGPTSWLGFPVSEENRLDNGGFAVFERGAVYWSEETGAHAVPRDFVDTWGTVGWEKGELGLPVAEPVMKDDILTQQFQGGFILRNKENKTFLFKGEFAKRYGELAETLGLPTTNEIPVKGGSYQEFEKAIMYWSEPTGAHFIKRGDIFDAWAKQGFEQGEYGFPREDQAAIPAGGEEMKFERGIIRQVNGRIVEEKN
ncbi:hypothetical protein EML15_05095 [Corynebacterium sp. sy017]|uniref:alpha/beta hydrolase-fold protein n=1 Tax=unclassified Corynebacterium TaxID=2624378 RepID=UPI001185B329|nr:MULTISPECIES: alpha/beta hydrolase-fold protein [unclassified Corynebacterium]MBP3088521.1 hypothetical protein [Corynebacterium sp. sy017]TSD91826.1 hypothetical protein ELY17_05095 [Corynebacterium sp. SY003]